MLHVFISTLLLFGFWVFSKQWPLAPNSPKWRITRANVSRRVTFFSKMANVEREQMYRVRGNGWQMSGECIESGENGWGMLGGQCRRKQDRLFYIQKKIFLCIKRSSLHSLNLPNSLNLLNSCKFAFCECIESGKSGWRMSGECIESDQNRLANVGKCIKSGQFSKMTILASTRIRQKWQIFGEYSNLTNSPASGHCL